MKFAVLATLLTIQILCAVEINDLKIAVVWNKYTYNTGTPMGWNVGDDQTGHAPEISKSQMKMLFSSFSDKITFDSNNPLDTSGIPDSLTNGEGIPDGPFQGELKNVRIYTWENFPLVLDRIAADFGGLLPDALVYINGGAEWGTFDTGDDGGLAQLLKDAAEQEIGLLTIGDESITEMRNADPSRQTFPVMGVQKAYRFKAFVRDTIREFDFMRDNNSSEWDVPDTVVLEGDPYEYKWFAIKRVNDGKEIYRWEASQSGGVVKYTDPDFIPTTGTNAYGEIAQPDILHAYGEWSINAKAVEVINRDLYAPEMADGIFNNHSVVLVGYNNSVYVSNVPWGDKLWANGQVIAEPGEELPNVKNFGSVSDGYFTFDKDYVVEVPNIDDTSLKDSILIIRSGTKVEAGLLGEDKHYLHTYRAGGYKNLRIDLSNNENIYSEVFPTLSGNGVESLQFRPWSKNGRIQADADVWAVNAKLAIKSFDEIAYEGFDKDAYYTAYLGDQRAGSTGTPHFTKVPEKREDFDKGVKDMRLDSIGYDSDGKLYHAIAAMQKNHFRTVVLGFQPTYLKDYEVVQALLSDATKWVGVDDYKLPSPELTTIYKGTETPLNGNQKIKTDLDSVRIAIDFSNYGLTLKTSPFTLEVTLDYAGQTKLISKQFESANRKNIETVIVKLSEHFTVDPSNSNNSEITVSAVCTPVSTAPFDQSDDVSGDLTFRKLMLTSDASDGTEFTGVMSVTFDAALDQYGEEVVGDDVTIIVNGEQHTGSNSVTVDVIESITLTASAQKPGYLDANDLILELTKDEQGTAIISEEVLSPGSLGSELVVTPNPVNWSSEKVRLHIPAAIRGEGVIAIFDAQGNLLERESVSFNDGFSYYWDLCNRSGKKVSNGTYLIVLDAKDPDGTVRRYKAMVGVQK